jgi:hypothetical protein
MLTYIEDIEPQILTKKIAVAHEDGGNIYGPVVIFCWTQSHIGLKILFFCIVRFIEISF